MNQYLHISHKYTTYTYALSNDSLKTEYTTICSEVSRIKQNIRNVIYLALTSL
jgi:hypothetical protein